MSSLLLEVQPNVCQCLYRSLETALVIIGGEFRVPLKFYVVLNLLFPYASESEMPSFAWFIMQWGLVGASVPVKVICLHFLYHPKL